MAKFKLHFYSVSCGTTGRDQQGPFHSDDKALVPMKNLKQPKRLQ